MSWCRWSASIRSQDALHSVRLQRNLESVDPTGMSNIQPLPFKRGPMLNYVDSVDEPFDVAIIGGGATGVYVALDAASRGLRTVLLERGDFASGTSSKSTKLIHGGIRYMQQGRLRLVRESLRERRFLFDNAPHLVKPLPIVVPAYSRWQQLKYTAGVKGYAAMSKGFGLGSTGRLNDEDTIAAVPGIQQAKLRGGIKYLDGQTDDARLALAIARTAASHGAALLNYVRVQSLVTSGGKISGVEAEDVLTGDSVTIAARVVINATGVHTDETLSTDPDGSSGLMRWSRGTHIVLDRSVLGGSCGFVIPKTSDGRVVYALPWLGKTLVGTTDVSVAGPDADPIAPAEDVEFLTDEISHYLPAARDTEVLSAFTGIRPLVSENASSSTSSLARSHRILVSRSGLVSITGGKWTTARLMAEQTVSRAVEVAGLGESRSATAFIKIDGFDSDAAADKTVESAVDDPDSLYGIHSTAITELEKRSPDLAQPISDRLPYRLSHAVYAVREEMAETLEDVLARRTRSLFLDADAAGAAASRVVEAIREHCQVDADWGQAELDDIDRFTAQFSYRSGA